MSFDSKSFLGDIKNKAFFNPFKSGDFKDHVTAAHQVDPGNLFRTGRTAATKAQEKQSLLIEKKSQQEQIALAESDDEIARRRSLAKSGKAGRQSLISTSEQGSSTLGGV